MLRRPAASWSGFSATSQLDRRAVRHGDHALVLERAVAVHLGHDERHVRLHAPRGRLVDRDRAAAHGVRDELARRRRADREEAEVEAAGLERLGRRLFDDAGRRAREPAERALTRSSARRPSRGAVRAGRRRPRPSRRRSPTLGKLERLVKRAHGLLDVVRRHVARDLDRGRRHDCGLDSLRRAASRRSSPRCRGGSSFRRR